MLNDPVKVKHFLAIASDYIDSELIFPLLSVLLINDEPFFEVLKSKNALLVWNTCEISRESSPELLKLLENIYKKYEKSILCALKGENESVVLQNLTVTQGLIKLFVGELI